MMGITVRTKTNTRVLRIIVGCCLVSTAFALLFSLLYSKPLVVNVPGDTSNVVLDGVISITTSDNFQEQTSTTTYSITTTEETKELIFQDGADENIMAGDRVRVEGTENSGHISVSKVQARPLVTALSERRVSASKASGLSAPGTKHVLVLLVNFQDTTPADSGMNDVRGALDSNRRYYNDTSYGKINMIGSVNPSASGDIFGWYDLPINHTKDVSAVLQQAMSAANNDVDFRQYDIVSIVAPFFGNTDTIEWSGATLGMLPMVSTPDGTATFGVLGIMANVPRANGNFSQLTLSHEIGHIMGLDHANFFRCGAMISSENGCFSVDYGDYFDIMGIADGQLNAPHMDYLSWFNPGNLQEVTTSGRYVLEPMELPSGNLKAIKIPFKKDPYGRSDYYYIEYRQPLGADQYATRFTPKMFAGAMIHRYGVFGLPNRSDILDPTPPGNNADPVLPVTDDQGRDVVFNDPLTNVTINTIEATPDRLVIDVQIGPREFVPPDVSFTSPAANSVVNGLTTFNVRAVDSSGISKVRLYYNDDKNQLTAISELTKSPYNFTYDVRDLPSGFTTIFADAVDRYGNQSLPQALWINVDNNDLTAPTIKLTAPTNGGSYDPLVTISADATDNVGVARVEFYDGPTLIKTRGNPPYNIGVKLSAGEHNIFSRAYDGHGNSQTSSTSKITVVPSTDSTRPSVTFVSPVEGDVLRGLYNITVNASDDAGVVRVEYYLDGEEDSPIGEPIAISTTPPFDASIDTSDWVNRPYRLRAKAFDAAGNFVRGWPVFIVTMNQPPYVNILSPTEKECIGVTPAAVADVVSEIGVPTARFYLDCNNDALNGCGATTVEHPYKLNLTLTPGTHALRVAADGYFGQLGISEKRTFVVSSSMSTCPTKTTVRISAPTTKQVVNKLVTLKVAATGTNIQRVVYKRDGNITLGIAAKSPYAYVLDTRNISNGKHSLTAVVEAADGITVSESITIFIKNTISVSALNITVPLTRGWVTGTAKIQVPGSRSFASLTYYLDNSKTLGKSTVYPFQMSWDSRKTTNGRHTVIIVARDYNGKEIMRKSKTIYVRNALSVSMANIRPGSVLSKSVKLAPAILGGYQVRSVTYLIDNEKIFATTRPPYTTTWNTRLVKNGIHNITATVVDSAGKRVTTTVKIRVTN